MTRGLLNAIDLPVGAVRYSQEPLDISQPDYCSERSSFVSL